MCLYIVTALDLNAKTYWFQYCQCTPYLTGFTKLVVLHYFLQIRNRIGSMVPNHTGIIVRSLVRVPGSGSDDTMEASLANLRNVSPIAAYGHASQTLPPTLRRPLVTTIDQNSETGQTASPSTSMRVHTMPKPQGRVMETLPGKAIVSTPARVVSVVASGQTQTKSLQTNALGMSPNVPLHLIQEREALLEENRRLKHQLYLFNQLITNKERLRIVVKRLGVEIPK
ncbi:hypothetical protein SK128_005292 [Halocaridina rubra]|uniref:Uncharacterized protein n=1 Tax=Halocaridina rubra TaxID=373956 RepID=A0AAN9A600_HALRR